MHRYYTRTPRACQPVRADKRPFSPPRRVFVPRRRAALDSGARLRYNILAMHDRSFRRARRLAAAGCAATLIGLTAVFLFSAQTGEASFETSDKVGEIILDFAGIQVPPDKTPSEVPLFFAFTVRNCAHLFLYFLLGVAVSCLFLPLAPRKPHALLRAVLLAAALCLVCALLDELHQSFTGGRTPSLRDAAIDACGFLPAVLMCGGVMYRLRQNTRRFLQ